MRLCSRLLVTKGNQRKPKKTKEDQSKRKKMKEIVFYTTQHCSLCEAAMDALLSLPEVQGSSLRTIDIALDDALMAQYGALIPVVAVGASQLEAPFDQDTLRQWLQNL